MNSSSIPAAFRTLLAAASTAVLCGGCYLMQSVQGQLALMSKSRPIERVIAAPSTSPQLRTQLESVAQIRDFATRELGLPDNGSYRKYADVGRPYVVWSVVSAPEFSIEPQRFCYPVVGCVAYRGYFVESRAKKFAAHQRQRGLDVAIDGVAAYSTLGHFDDPILNTMLEWNDVELAAIIFHELTHQFLYVPNDASFNEALATTVEEEGVKRWLLQQGRDQDLKTHQVEQQRYLAVVDLLNDTRAKLNKLYASGAAHQAMLELKRQQFAALRAKFATLRAAWGGHAPFEAWFKEDINNAQLASVATYFACVPGFERELAAVHGDLRAFFLRVRQLAQLSQKARDARICGSPD